MAGGHGLDQHGVGGDGRRVRHAFLVINYESSTTLKKDKNKDKDKDRERDSGDGRRVCHAFLVIMRRSMGGMSLKNDLAKAIITQWWCGSLPSQLTNISIVIAILNFVSYVTTGLKLFQSRYFISWLWCLKVVTESTL